MSLINKMHKSKLMGRIFHTLDYCLQKELSDCDSVLDLGCGPSSPIQFCQNIKKSVGVEVFKPYFDEAKKNRTHTELINKKISEISFPNKSFDAVVMIEVLEHLQEKEGKAIIKKAEKWAKKKIIISSPNGFINQKAVDNNPWQKHLSGWDLKKMKSLGFEVKGLAGLKFLRQEVENDIMDEDFFSSIKLQPKVFWFLIASLSQCLVYRWPVMAFELFSIKNKSKIQQINNQKKNSVSRKKSFNYTKNYYIETGLDGFNSDVRTDHKAIIEYGKIKKSDKILEIGCGMGVLLDKLSATDKVGIESNDFAVRVCQEKGLNVQKHIEVDKLPYKDGVFDTVIMNEVIEHIADPFSAVGEIFRVLKKEGKVILTTTNKNILVRGLATSHCSEMTFQELENLFESRFDIQVHLVRGTAIMDYLGRKIIFPLGKLIRKSNLFSSFVNNSRKSFDSSHIQSDFRASKVKWGAQQLLVVQKRGN